SASTERQSSGIRELDSMLEGQGFYKGSTVLVSGTAGTGKSSLAARFAESVCESGKRCIYFAYEEGPRQIMRNMGSIGMKLGTWVERRRLIFHATRPTEQGLEMHLATIHKLVTQHRPSAVIIDPVSNFELIGEDFEIKAMLMRLVDFLKQNQVTCLFTSLTTGGDDLESTQMGISSLMDTWLLLRDIEIGGERNRGLYVLKSRGMAHSNQIREFLITSQGIRLVDAYLGPEGVLTGSARLQQEARDRENETTRQQDEQRKLAVLERRRRAVERQIQELRAELAEEDRVVKVAAGETDLRKKVVADDRAAMGRSRGNGRRQT